MVEGGPSFLRVLRYVMLNPVAAGYVAQAQDWRWSSFRQAAGLENGSTFLSLGSVWDMFDPADRIHAQQCFQRFVDQPSVESELASGLLVGSDGFVRRFEPSLAVHRENRELVHAERFAARPPLSELLPEISRRPATREAASRAFHVYAFSLREIAEHIGVSPSAVWVWTRRAPIAA